MRFHSPEPFDPDTLLRHQADANFCEMFSVLARAAAATSQHAAVRGLMSSTLIATGVPVPLFNPAFLAHGGGFAALMARAPGFFRRRRLPWALVVPEHVRRAPSGEALREAGLYVLQTMPVYTHPTRPGAGWPPHRDADLEIREGGIGSEVVADHRALLAASFGIPEEMSRVVLPDGLAADPTERLRLYVAYRNNEPVGSAALCTGRDVAGIYNVAAHPEHRRRGIATALMRRVLGDARAQGLKTCVLQSSSAGLPLYSRLGFRRLTTYTIYRGSYF